MLKEIKVETIDDVFEIVWNRWGLYVNKRIKSKKYIESGFDEYILCSIGDSDWENSSYFREYFDNKDIWINRYSNSKYVDKEVLLEFKEYFDEMYNCYMNKE
jgi:hypothetical protein